MVLLEGIKNELAKDLEDLSNPFCHVEERKPSLTQEIGLYEKTMKQLHGLFFLTPAWLT